MRQLRYFFFFLFITCYSIASSEQPNLQEISILRNLAKECSSLTVLSHHSQVQWDSFYGLLESSDSQRKYLQIDVEYPSSAQLNLAQEIAEKNNIAFTFWRIDAMHIEMEPTDMVVIDSLHYDVNTFASKARKYMCIFYTNGSWSNQDGLNSEWILLVHDSHRRFAILKRLDETAVPLATYDAEVENYLKHKIILCTGPAFSNYDLLKKTTEADMRVIPFKKIFVATNEPAVMNITFNDKVPVRQLIPNQGKQLDCLNSICVTLKNAINDPEVADDDIIIFKHETVYINDMNLIKKAVRKILNGYDMVARSWAAPKYAKLTDAFFVRVSAVREIVKDFPLVTSFTSEATFCEEYFTAYITHLLPKVYSISYHHSNGGFTELGFYHIFSVYERDKPHWDRRNYHQLFLAD